MDCVRKTETNRNAETVSDVAGAPARHRKVDRHAKSAIAGLPRPVEEAVHPFAVLEEIKLEPSLTIARRPRDFLEGGVGVGGQAEGHPGIGRCSGCCRLAVGPKEAGKADRRERQRQRGPKTKEISGARALANIYRASGHKLEGAKSPFVITQRPLGAGAAIHEVEQRARQPPLGEQPQVGDRGAALESPRRKRFASHQPIRRCGIGRNRREAERDASSVRPPLGDGNASSFGSTPQTGVDLP